MPMLDYEIPDVYVSVTRPTNINIIRSIINSTGMPEDTFIEYAGLNDNIPTYRSLMSNNREVDTAKFQSYGKVQVTADDRTVEDRLMSTPFTYNENKIVWRDRKRGIALQPYYEQVEVTLNFRYRTPDQNDAMDWQTKMKRRIMEKWFDESYQTGYKFVVPQLVIAFFQQFYKMKEAVAGEGDTFDDWMKKHTIQPSTVLTMLNGEMPQWAFEEIQLDVLGNFDFQAPPKEVKNQENITFEVEFSYKYRYDRPIGFMLTYPLVLHNQLMPKKFRPDRVIYDPYSYYGLGLKARSRYDRLMSTMGLPRTPQRAGSVIPWFDDFWPNTTVGDTTNIAQFLIQVTPEDPTLVLDLKNIKGYYFHPKLMEYMTACHGQLTRRTGSAINVSLYMNDSLWDPSALYVDENLVVRTRVNLKLTNVHHLRVALFNQLFFLQPPAEDLLRSNPEWANVIFDGLAPEMRPNGLLPKTLKGLYIGKFEWEAALRYLKQTDEHFKLNKHIMRPTILSTLFVKHEEKA